MSSRCGRLDVQNKYGYAASQGYRRPVETVHVHGVPAVLLLSPECAAFEPTTTTCEPAIMTLTQFRYLLAIADSGLNITTAAERVHATQPGVSKQLKQLEDELGFQLFSRKGKSLLAITPAGEQVRARARVIVAEAANIRAIAADLRGEEAGELTIATTHTQARFVLPDAITRLKQRYPDVSVHLMPQGDAQVMTAFERGQADLAIVSTTRAPPEGGLVIPLFRWQRAVIAPVGHPLTRIERALTLSDISRHPLVSYESSLRAESSLAQAFAAAKESPRFAMTSRDADLIKTYVRAGLGVGILAEMALLPEDNRDLRVLTAQHLLAPCTTWLVLRRDRVPRSYALTLLELVAPQVDRRDAQRALAGENVTWPEAPQWREREVPKAAVVRAA
jgi:LysR family transcriptional regulator, cys regulon transcriptional activator